MGQRKGSHNIVLGPEQLATLREVFDAVWDEVAPDYNVSVASIEVGRLRLANALLGAHHRGGRDTVAVKAAAPRRLVMGRHQRRIFRQPMISAPGTAFAGFGQAQ